MQRRVEIVVPPDRSGELLQAIGGLEGLLGLRISRSVSLRPPGDVISVELLNRALPALMRLLEDRGVGADERSAIQISELSALVSPTMNEKMTWETSNSSWEEMEAMVAKEGNMTPSAALLMAVAGALAVVGVLTGALHFVIAAMVIAPGFEPIARIALGAMAGSRRVLRRGIIHTLVGYAALLAGAAATTLVLRGFGLDPLNPRASYVPGASLLALWSTVQPSSVLLSAAAGVAGALLIASGRSVLTAGVMIALGLVPAAALAAVGLATGDAALLGGSAVRWTVDAALVAGTGAVVFGWKRVRLFRRKMLA